MTTTAELDPRAIRETLTLHRRNGKPFDIAWPLAVGNVTITDEDRPVYRFMEAHFRAAYYNTDAPLGRCRVPERDVSFAVPMMQMRPDDSVTYHRCQSGDGCEDTPTHGRFRATFCERHHAPLAELAAKLDLDTEAANPRMNGNTVIFQRQVA